MGYKVLLADDSITVQKIVKLSLTEEGIEVIAVGNGEQAVQQLETLRPDLVMADVFMPGKDGYEVCEFIKAHPQLNHIPVILLVHAFEPFDPDRAKKVGADHQLTKPFQSIRTLVTSVRDMLETPAKTATTAPGLALQESTTAVPLAAAAPFIAQPILSQPEEEFAVVSSLLSDTTPLPEHGVVLDETTIAGFALTPAPTNFTPASSYALPEAGISMALMGGAEPPAADLFPSSDLLALSQAEWQSTTPVPSNPAPSDLLPPSFAPLSLAPPAMMMDTMDASAEDILELSDVLLPDTASWSPSVAVTRTNQFAADSSLLAVLGTTPAFTEEVLPASLLVESNQATFAGSFDVVMGHVAPPAEVPVAAETSTSQDVSTGIVATPDRAAALHISEAVIEEIVNRVVQRLSTNAIQEIAWEVVPEMAELLIRKQLSQQSQLAH